MARDGVPPMSFSSLRAERTDMASAASDRCSEESFGMMGVADTERLKSGDRTSKLARFKERQLKVLQAVKQRSWT